ncbi:MAG: thymidine phosphorylase [Eubacterium sp.]|nr:thymidine phosphorylase [Eubacterium sp.]
MNIVEIIEKKKKGNELTSEEIRYTIEGMLSGNIKDYQMSALLMAICLKGMNAKETTELTLAMRDSGDVLDLSCIGKTVVDKHSTGGVGDKTTLIIGPLMASLGVPIAKMSGRGLGITGGTIDKLDSIPGFNSDISDEEFIDLIKTVGVVDAAQNKNLAPADKYLYALRDVTGTVDSIPLIASSIMSKKLASGADAIVLDVKCGTGAFMTDYQSAKALAEAMISIAKLAGKKCIAVITDMNQPLGYAVGNYLEVREAVRFLAGKEQNPRLYRIVVELCKQMYKLSDMYTEMSDDEVEGIIKDAISSGKAYKKFKEFISGQGGDVGFVESLESAVDVDNISYEYRASKSGVISSIDAQLIGRASLALGAGRVNKESEIDLYAGIIFDKVVGDFVNEGDVIATLYAASGGKLEAAKALIEESVSVSDSFSDSDIIIDVL